MHIHDMSTPSKTRCLGVVGQACRTMARLAKQVTIMSVADGYHLMTIAAARASRPDVGSCMLGKSVPHTQFKGVKSQSDHP